MPTQIPVGSPLAKKIYSAATFAAVQAEPGFMNLISGPAPKDGEAEAKMKGQSSADMPVVKITDLSKGGGNAVSVDLFNILTGKPVMADKILAGQMMSLNTSSMDVTINQTRGGADSGGRMTQQRTVHNLRSLSLAALTNWGNRLEDQTSLVHLAGARGSQNTADWVVPLSTDPDFADILVNPIKAPTKNRQYYCNDATSAATIDTTDPLALIDIDRFAANIGESSVPLQSVKIKGDDYAWNNPLYVMFVTKRQWLYLQARAGSSWRTFLQNAYERRTAGMKHPLFYGDGGMWQGILVKPMNRYAIRFNAGDAVTYDTGGTDGGTYTEATSTVAAGMTVDRAIIMGAQALCKAYGAHQNSDYYYDWNEELTDHKNKVEISIAMMCGAAKTRFRINNIDTDHGVAVIDSYAPDPTSAAGLILLGT